MRPPDPVTIEAAGWPKFIRYIAAGFVLAAASILTAGITALAGSILVVEASQRGTRPPKALSVIIVAISAAACVFGLWFWIAWVVFIWQGDRLSEIRPSPLGAAGIVIGGLLLAAATWAALRLISRARARREANLQDSVA